MMRIIMAHNIFKVFLGIKLCWYLILKKLVSKNLKFGPKRWFLYFKPVLLAIFVTKATIKIKINARNLHLSYSSVKTIRKKWWKATFRFWLQRGPKWPLNARTPFGLSLHLYSFFVCASSEGSNVRDNAAGLDLMHWPIVNSHSLAFHEPKFTTRIRHEWGWDRKICPQDHWLASRGLDSFLARH